VENNAKLYRISEGSRVRPTVNAQMSILKLNFWGQVGNQIKRWNHKLNPRPTKTESIVIHKVLIFWESAGYIPFQISSSRRNAQLGEHMDD
jgi:hypothetical protein